MEKFNVSEICGKAWAIFKENWLVLVAVYLAVVIAQSVVSSLFGPSAADVFDPARLNSMSQDEQLRTILQSAHYTPGQFLSGIVAQIFGFGMMIMMMGMVKGRVSDFSIDFWKQDLMSYVHYILCDWLVNFIIVLGLACCIVPGIYLAARLCMASPAIANNPKMSFIDAIKHSWKITNGYTIDIVFLGVAFIVIFIAGLVCCCVGVVPAACVISLAECVAYLTLVGEPEEEEEFHFRASGPQTL